MAWAGQSSVRMGSAYITSRNITQRPQRYHLIVKSSAWHQASWFFIQLLLPAVYETAGMSILLPGERNWAYSVHAQTLGSSNSFAHTSQVSTLPPASRQLLSKFYRKRACIEPKIAFLVIRKFYVILYIKLKKHVRHRKLVIHLSFDSFNDPSWDRQSNINRIRANLKLIPYNSLERKYISSQIAS